MRTQIRADLLVPGDVVVQGRKKFNITGVKTNGNETVILYAKLGENTVHHMTMLDNKAHLTVINDGWYL
ncbi:hypothetical protein DCC85_14200 [Paenibacillus sp. CAA11]|uniref:hypothetical protein n=1 Tax=Paenibacillus sp. CAA11 TaxID=1532905 RepID=UPI000D3C34EC|nr:hypothetical protein [Paenibacillus sp. CAA11]AWB45261.1 hypothetical protein DCC85_14200 [Paenibacillus sp. CAA11]